jgi:hypothetical protein
VTLILIIVLLSPLTSHSPFIFVHGNGLAITDQGNGSAPPCGVIPHCSLIAKELTVTNKTNSPIKNFFMTISPHFQQID